MSAQPAQILIDLFGKGEVGDAVMNFDFSKDATRDDYLHLNLAAAYGGLNGEAVKQMDDRLKIMMACAITDLRKIPARDRSFDRDISEMTQQPFLELMKDDIVARASKLVKDSPAAFKFDGSPGAHIVQEAKTWFTSLVTDSDVIKSTRIDVDVLAKIVAQTGAIVENFETFSPKNQYHEKTIVDIGVIRFPDAANPFFKLYRIQLKAWLDSSRTVFPQTDKTGISGDYSCKEFKPRDEEIAELRPQAKNAMIQIAEDLFI